MEYSTQYSEIENKYTANHVDVSDFCKWAKILKPYKKTVVSGYDVYYRHGKDVVRHRYSVDEKYNCLTVKCRKSTSSIMDRVEVDLYMGSGVGDTKEFLKQSGFQEEFAIWKDAWIYFIEDSGIELTLVLYDITEVSKNSKKSDKTARFLEVEVEKSPNVSPKVAFQVLSKWDKKLREKFSLDKPLNQSLYEIYGKRKYRVSKGKK